MTAMRFADWIKLRLDELRTLMTPGDGGKAAAVSAASAPSDLVVDDTSDKLTLKFSARSSNVSAARRAMETFCGECGLDAAATEEIGLVFNEVVANVIRHAYAGGPAVAAERPVEVVADRVRPVGVRIAMRDWGSGKMPTLDHRNEPDPYTPGGLGLICLRRLSDEARFEPLPDGMRLILVRTTRGSLAGKPIPKGAPERRVTTAESAADGYDEESP